MFSFGFAVDDEGDLVQNVEGNTTNSAVTESSLPDDVPARECSLDELLSALPARISYSPLEVHKTDGSLIHIPRRDLFDARFQLMSGDKDDSAAPGLDFIDTPSDLVRGVYEGGFKTWECASDIVQYTSTTGVQQGDAVLEAWCGTAVPSAYLLSEMLNQPDDRSRARAVHLQDYNQLVLELVALPNLILAWYFSPAAASVRDATHTSAEAGELDLDDDLLRAFREALSSRHITLRFFHGSWSSWQLPQAYDLVLSSETVYEPSSLPALVALLHASGGRRLIAAKRVYFGVGGGVREFIQEVQKAGGEADTVWETSSGVSRAILDVRW
ncbi:hypothetical protein AURDEDRAFT_66492 [Auricularia subglabra TFB-10046 SS5]|nr:hypothetical protein AURDEDRAFT_66492 [Auricularia subglabra TFB-10046 SS5]